MANRRKRDEAGRFLPPDGRPTVRQELGSLSAQVSELHRETRVLIGSEHAATREAIRRRIYDVPGTVELRKGEGVWSVGLLVLGLVLGAIIGAVTF